jgi:hypothetical protein
MSMPASVWSACSRSRLLSRTRRLMRAMSSGPSTFWPSTDAITGLQALCDIGQTRLAMDTSGAASHSPQPDNAPGAHAHQQRILAAVADVEDLRHGKIEEINRLDLHGIGAPTVLNVPAVPPVLHQETWHNRAAWSSGLLVIPGRARCEAQGEGTGSHLSHGVCLTMDFLPSPSFAWLAGNDRKQTGALRKGRVR